MAAVIRTVLLGAILATAASAAPPAELASALEHLRDQKSYSWEVINADPGPVSQRFETRLGTVTSVQQNLLPNLKGQIDRNGDMLIQREWSDGLRLDTIIMASGASATKTPEGWMTDREILTAQAEERLQSATTTPRATWLRRADRPEVRRPDQELAPFLRSTGPFEVSGSTYVVRGRSRGSDSARTPEDDETASLVTVTMHLKGGVVRDYEVKLEGTRRTTRARIAVPISEQRIVIITYVPVTRIDIPPEAREKLAGTGARSRRPDTR
jgi:hypothetical protein